MDKDGERVFQDAVLGNMTNQLKENIDVYIKQIQMYSKLRKAKYDSLIEEGFTEKQAFEIVIKTGIV